jgi:hypothetical protein
MRLKTHTIVFAGCLVAVLFAGTLVTAASIATQKSFHPVCKPLVQQGPPDSDQNFGGQREERGNIEIRIVVWDCSEGWCDCVNNLCVDDCVARPSGNRGIAGGVVCACPGDPTNQPCNISPGTGTGTGDPSFNPCPTCGFLPLGMLEMLGVLLLAIPLFLGKSLPFFARL